MTSTSDCGERDSLRDVSVERMDPCDLDVVLAIERACFPSAWTRESYLVELRNPRSWYVVARQAGEVIGYAGMWVIEGEAHITTLAVHGARRQRGLGSLLLSQLLGVAAARGAARVTLEVRERNLAAQSLYEKFGFEKTGELFRYYGDTGENAVVMCKTLAPGRERGRDD